MQVGIEARDLVTVDRYTRGLVGPSLEMTEVVKDGGRIRTVSPPGDFDAIPIARRLIF